MIKKNKGYRFRLKPNKEQMVYLEKAFGCSRKMYNLYVDMLYKQLDEKNFINGKIDYKAIDLPTPAIIKKDYEYMKEIDSLAFANVQLNFRDAIKKYNSEFDGKTYSKKAYNLAKAYDAIIVEDINLRAVGQCLKLGKSLSDNGFGTFRNFLKYKLEDMGKQFIKIDKWFPSSKMCSNCGTMKEKLQLSDRIYKCEKCGCIIDRDYNAALNIKEAGSALLAW
ncbi:putative transposase DNA-binding domain protein [Clostridium liquoris]|uniref:Putative transposase DNA-binding domain protein n=1 Tax=Clostridium liquoris TaxID=1289519 RepID=A0A2T0B8F1_9CLOT|nr:RNA-guided endonuclease TnpB family protein [Clostridium liquoris]PRR80170.1 putative transposase DNA-binding domain protein [Clostridium liquoris]